jgi:nicotinate-nucleotide adenylyltransferase
MNIGLFGGTFDPIHRGHLALARAALERHKLNRIYLVPSGVPPHKQQQPLSAFVHRYAMVVLATAQDRQLLPSLLEAPEESVSTNKKDRAKPHYTIDTVRRLKQSFKSVDKLFVLAGIDAFADIAKWHQAEALFREVEFIVASRPGYSLADVANALPESLRPKPEVTRPFQKQAASGDLVLKGATIHLLDEVHQPISATAIREAAAGGKPLGRFVDASVADYIKKIGLYKSSFSSFSSDPAILQITDCTGAHMAQNHYTTKTKRRPKNSNRKDFAASTMESLRKLAAADKKQSSK